MKLKRLITEITQNILKNVQTTEANDKLKERFDIQTLLTELNKYNKFKSQPNKFKKSQTPQAIEDLADIHDIYMLNWIKY